MKEKMEEKHVSPFTPDQESFLAIATNKKTAMDDITMSSLPGTPIAASTVMREKGTMKERVTANGKDSRGSLFGSNDPSLAQSSDSPQLMITPENIIQESPLEAEDADQGSSEDHLALSLEEKSSDNVEEFLRTHNVSGLLQKISLSQLSLSDKPLETRQSLMSQTSDTSLGILNLDSMQDISQELEENYGNGKSQSGSEDRDEFEKGEGSHISDKEMKDAVNNILKASKKSSGSSAALTSRSQRSPNGSNQLPHMSQQWEEDKPIQPQSLESVTNGHMIAHHNYSSHSEDKSQSNEGAMKGVQRGYRTAPQADSSKPIQRTEMPDVGLTATSKLVSSDIGKHATSLKRRSDGIQGLITSKSNAPVSQGLESLDCNEEEEDNQIDLSSLKAGLDQLDAMFFDPSPSSKSQRSGSGDGEESHSSSLQPSPKIPGESRDWLSNTAQHLRTDSQMSALSIDFAEVEDQGSFLQDAFEDGACESEIDTEDEIEAARKSQQEAETVMDDIVRPGIEGGSSGEEDAPPLAGALEPRQSAEGVVAVSPVPGDGGGGGDGMSDRDSDSGTSIGERSPVRNGMVGSGRSQDDELGSDEEAPPEDRDIEGQARSQPVGDGIVDNSLTSGRQVRFASHDDITRWTPSGSAFHSRLRRPRNSEMENGDESLFPPRSITPTPPEDPSLLNSQFLQPSHASLSGILGDAGAEWNQQEDSLLFSQASAQPVQPVDGGASRGPATSHPRELERTLTPGASISDESLPLRGCSLGIFGASPIEGDSELPGPKETSHGEDFLPLQAEGRSGSDASSKRSSRETGERHSMRRYVPGESDSSAVATDQINQVIYLDENGKGVTDLAFRTSIPMMHKLGAVNPFESFDNQEAVERDIVNSIDFGISDNEEFLPSDQAAAVLDADESEFREANIFHQDEHMSPDAYQEASDWSFHNKSHVTVKDSITGQEDFCRISLGSFFGKRTEALGSLSGSADIQRPTFGIDDMVSPPAREPVALVNVSQQSSRTQSHPQESSSSFNSNHRPNGEGGDSKGDESQEPSGSENEPAHDAERTISGMTDELSEDQTDEEEVTLGGEIGPVGSIGGTETPPLNLSDIAGIIGQISSKSNSEEILQKIIALSNKRSLIGQSTQEEDRTLAGQRKNRSATSKEKKTSQDSETGDPSRRRSSAHRDRHKVTDGKDIDSQRRDYRGKRIKRTTLEFDDTNASTTASAVTNSIGSRVGKPVLRPTQQKSEDSFVNESTEVPLKRAAVSASSGDTHVCSSETGARNEEVDSQSHMRKVSAAMEDRETDSNRKETLNQSQNGSHHSHDLKEQEQSQRAVGVKSKKLEVTARDPKRPSLAGSTLENEDESWATSSSIRKSSVLSPRGFFKTSGNVEREILSLSPHKLEMKKRHSSEEEEPEEEISPILGTGIELDGKGRMQRHYDHPSALLREESEPDGEPNAAELSAVGVLSAIPKTSTSQNSALPLQGGHVADDVTTAKQTDDSRNHVASTEIDKGPLDSDRSVVSLQSSSRESINSKGMFVVGQHKVKQLSASLLLQSFNDTLYPNSKPDVPSSARQTFPSHSRGQSFISGREQSGALSPQECTTSSTLSSSEEEAGHRSPSPPLQTSVLTGLRPEEDVPPSTSSHVSSNKRQIGTLNIRLEIDGEESVGKVPFPVPSTANEIVDYQLKSHVSAAAGGSPGGSSYMAGQYGQSSTLTSAQLPALLTSHSMMDAHLAGQIVNSRPGSSLSLDRADPRLSVQSLDSDRTSLSGHSVSSHHGPGLSSQSYLGDTFTNLGRRPHSYQSSSSQDFSGGVLQTTPYIEQFRRTQPGLPYQDIWHHGSLTESGTGLGVTREQVPHFPYSSSVGGVALPRQPSSYLVPQQQAPIMSIGTAPRGTRHSSLPYGATHLGLTGLALPSNVEQQYPQFPVAAGSFGNNVCAEQRPNSVVNGSYPSEYQRDPSSSCLNLPAHARFKGVCCVGIASHISLPLRNSSNRWLHCFMDIVQVTANGEEMPPEGHSTFIIKERTTVAPHGTEQIKVIFVPKHPGIYTALLHVGWSTVVANGDRNGTPHVPPQVVSLQALAETPCVEILEDSDVFFGEMVHQSSRSRSLHLINRGRCTVPIRLFVTSSSSSYSCFSVSTGEKRSDVVTATYQRGSRTTSMSPVHISLKGHPGSNSDDIATATTIWVHFKAPPQRTQDAEKNKDAETYSAQLDVEMDVPEKVMTLHSVNLRAVVGSANLHIPRKMHTLNFSASVGNVDRLKLPLKNSGSIRLEIKFAISRAEELFSVRPERLKLKPAEEASVEITYAPKEAPSAVESLLTMKVDADGPQYEVVMRGEGTIEEKKISSKDTPCLFSNKQFLSWGGVAVGRALQQKIVLRNSSSSMPLKLKVSITGGPDFQLQSSFGSQLQLTDSKSLILKPEEDLPVNILYAPTMVTTSQGLLVMKPVGGCSKYTVPLSGYGGVSSVSVDELQAVGDTSVLAVGDVVVGRRKVFTMKVSNNGDRAAFVKVICFSDLKAKVKLPKTHLNVEPHEFVIPAKAVEKLSIVYQPTERDAALCYCQSSMVAAVALFSGDEVMRKQYQKALEYGQAQDYQMSADNPLRGVSFDKKFLKEKEKSESSLPSRPNDVQLFYSCMSRLMVAIVGDASTGTQDSPRVNGIDTSLNGDPLSTGARNSSVLIPVSPPVKGTPAHHQSPSVGLQHGPSLRLPSNGSTGRWALHPDHVILTWSPVSNHSQGTGRIHFCNYTERKLSFELTWPGHILTVTPQNGMVEPNEQKVLLVSANPSIQSKGVILPWSGTIYVSCDNQKKEIKVQIREDLALDTSILPASSKQLQSLSTEPSTPAVQRRPLPNTTVSPKELKVRSKVIRCEDACVGQKTEFIFEFENTKPYPMKWSLSSFAPAYLKQADGTVCRTMYSVFRFESTSGEMTPGQKMQLSLHFMPREEGDYSQFWDLESSSSQNLVSHKTRIELSGHGLPKKPQAEKFSRSVPKQNLYEQALAKQLTRSQPVDLTKASKLVSSSHPPVGLSKTTAVPSGKGQSARQVAKKASIVVSELARFDRCEVGHSQTVTVRLKNCSMDPQTVRFVSPQEPFSITHHEHVIKPRHYLKLPVTFHPKARGHFEAPFVIQTELQENLVVRLIGECL